MTTRPVRGPSSATREPPAAGPMVEASRSVTPDRPAGPFQRHPAALGRLRDHDLLGEIAGAAGRADQRDQDQQERKGQQVRAWKHGNRGGRSRAGQIGGPGNGPWADPVHEWPSERLDHHVRGHLAEGDQSGLGRAAGRDEHEPGQARRPRSECRSATRPWPPAPRPAAVRTVYWICRRSPGRPSSRRLRPCRLLRTGRVRRCGGRVQLGQDVRDHGDPLGSLGGTCRRLWGLRSVAGDDVPCNSWFRAAASSGVSRRAQSLMSKLSRHGRGIV